MSARRFLFAMIISLVCSGSLVLANDAPTDISLTVAVSNVSETKIVSSDGSVGDHFGNSVSISGDYAVVGAVYDDDNGETSGSAYIFKRDAGNWTQEAKLTASDGAASDVFGGSVSISDDYAIVGANGDDDNGNNSGSAYIFKRDGTSWTEQAKLTASDGVEYYCFGNSVSISGDYAVVGAYEDEENGNGSGAAYIFKRDGTNWTEQTKLAASDAAEYDFFGLSVSISGDYAVVGSYGDDDNGSFSGSAYVFKRDGTSWIQEAKLTASDGAADDYFGQSVSISGDYTVIGANRDDDNGTDSGSAYVFKRDGTSWTEEAKLTASDGAMNDYFGCSVSISGVYAIVGANGNNDNGPDSGSAYIFVRNGTSWTEQIKITASDGAAEDFFGSVSIFNDIALIGAYGDDDNGSNSGSAYVYDIQLAVKENSPAGTWVSTITGVDPDGDTLTFSLQSDPSSYFEIVEDSGEWKLQVAPGATLDYETTSSHDITIRADDGNGGIYDEVFTIIVLDIDEAPTDISLSNSDIAENSPAGTLVGIITGTDPNGDTLSFSLQSDPSGNFEVIDDGGTWKLQVAPGATLDYETAISHDITIRADDGNGWTYDENFTIAVLDVNEAPDDISLTDNEIAENSSAGTLVGIVTGTDPDDDTLTFSLQSDPSGNFEVINDGGTWKLQAAPGATLDYETASSHDITIRADDGNGGIYDEIFTLIVLDVNEAPDDISLSNNEIAENSPAGTLVGIITGTDPDDDTVFFYLQSDPSGNFEVIYDAGTWKLQVASSATLDYETASSHNITIRAYDEHAEIYDENFTIIVLDVNEAPIDIDLSALETRLTASDGEELDNFGLSVSISGDYAVVGAQGDDDNGSASGSAYIFARSGSSWTEETKLTASDGAANDHFGCSTSISDDYVISGAHYGQNPNPGSAYIFKRDGSSWTEQTKITASDGSVGDYFGESVSISGDYAVVGAPGDYDNGYFSGSAYVFNRAGISWTEQTKIIASDGDGHDSFGSSVSMSGDYAVIGSPYSDGNGIACGSAYVFVRTGTSWTEQTKIFAADGVRSEAFGCSVSISGDYAVIGADRDGNNGYYSGAAYIFKRDGSSWTEQTKIIASDGELYDGFGHSVSISGDYAVIGTGLLQKDPGSAYVFKRNGTSWTEVKKLTAPDGEEVDCFGSSVSISGNYAVIGAYRDDDNGTDSGSAYIYNLNNLQPDVEENSPAGTLINTITGVDPENDTLTFSLHSDPSGYFEVINHSGTWKLQLAAGATLDYEAAISHNITIRADDGNGGIYDEEFTIMVLDVNEAPIAVPAFALVPETGLYEMLKVYFHASGCFDPDGEAITEYEWKLGDTIISTALDFNYIFANRGPHEVFLRVKDEHELWSEPVSVVVDWLQGDINGDDHVDYEDFIILRTVYSTTCPPADFDQSGRIDFTDFVILKTHYGEHR
ncbi:MAG: cadherin domain-containing protein [Planctomycetes bacterium]|nr:cadherin domain-containing protein [Planctomycetota bacterium]